MIFLNLIRVGNLAESKDSEKLFHHFKTTFHEILVPRFKDSKHEVRGNLLNIFNDFLKLTLDSGSDDKKLTTRRRGKKNLEEIPAIKSLIGQVVEISIDMLLTQESEIQLSAIKVLERAVEYISVSLPMVALCFTANVRVVSELIKLFAMAPKKLDEDLSSLVSKLIYSPNQVISEAAADFLIESQKPLPQGKEGLLAVIKFLSELDPSLGCDPKSDTKLQLILSCFQDRLPLLSNYDMMIGLLEEAPNYFELIISILIAGLKRVKAYKKRDKRSLIAFSYSLLKKAKFLINTYKMDKIKFPKIVKLFGLLEGEALNKIEAKPALEELSKAVSVLADYETEIEALSDICCAFQKMSVDAVLTKDIIDQTTERLYARVVKPIQSELPFSHESDKFSLTKALVCYSQVIENMDPTPYASENFILEFYQLKDFTEDADELMSSALLSSFNSFHLWSLRRMMIEPSIALYTQYLEIRNKTLILLHEGLLSSSETLQTLSFNLLNSMLSLVSSDKIGEAKTMFYDPAESLERIKQFLLRRLQHQDASTLLMKLSEMFQQCSVCFFYASTNGLLQKIYENVELVSCLDDAFRVLRNKEIQNDHESKFFFWKVIQETIFNSLTVIESSSLRPFIKRACKVYFQNPKKVEEKMLREKFVLFIADTIVKVFEDEKKLGTLDSIGLMMKGRSLDVRLMRKLLAFFQIELQKRGKEWQDEIIERKEFGPIERFSDILLKLSQAEMLKEEGDASKSPEEKTKVINEESEEDEDDVYNSPNKEEGNAMEEEEEKERNKENTQKPISIKKTSRKSKSPSNPILEEPPNLRQKQKENQNFDSDDNDILKNESAKRNRVGGKGKKVGRGKRVKNTEEIN